MADNNAQRRGAAHRLGHGAGNQLGPRRLGRGSPGVLRGVARLGAGVEDDLADVDRGDPVDHRMVGFCDDGEPVARHALDQVHLPQRSAAVERPALHARHELMQLSIGARAREGGPAYVVVEVEVLVVDPHGVGQPARHPADALAIARDESDAVTDQVDQALVVEAVLGRLEEGDPADVHRRGRPLEVQERHIERAEPVRHRTPPPHLTVRSSWHARPMPRGATSFVALRLAVFLATGGLLLVSGCAGGSTSGGTRPSAGSASPSSVAGKSAKATDIVVSVKDGKVSPKTHRVKVAVGSSVRILVSSDVDDELHVHGYEIQREVSAGQSATMEFTADQAGVFEVGTQVSNLLLLQLQVQ